MKMTDIVKNNKIYSEKYGDRFRFGYNFTSDSTIVEDKISGESIEFFGNYDFHLEKWGRFIEYCRENKIKSIL